MSRITPLCLLISCAPAWSEPLAPLSEPGEIVVCVDLPAEHMAAAERAVASWDVAIGGWMRVEALWSPPVDGCTKTIVETDEEYPGDLIAAGWVNEVGGSEIKLRRGRYEVDPEWIVMHELGHSLGAQHVSGTLMQSAHSWSAKRCPDVVTVAQVAAWHKADMRLVRWCE